MGMFDYVKYECVCPVCKNKVDGFQTKDKECILDVVEPQSVDNFYTHCQTCGVWVHQDKWKKGAIRGHYFSGWPHWEEAELHSVEKRLCDETSSTIIDATDSLRNELKH